jgi:hypothetical protein
MRGPWPSSILAGGGGSGRVAVAGRHVGTAGLHAGCGHAAASGGGQAATVGRRAAAAVGQRGEGGGAGAHDGWQSMDLYGRALRERR